MQEMALFASVFPWCSPPVFWDLTLDEYAALRPHVDAAVNGGE